MVERTLRRLNRRLGLRHDFLVARYDIQYPLARFLENRSLDAEAPDHLIHFNGERFLGPYPDVMPGLKMQPQLGISAID